MSYSTFAEIGVEERGRLHANPNRNQKTQMASIGKDACSEDAPYGAVGRDVIKGIDGDLTAITIDGVEYTFDSAVDHTDEEAVVAAIVDKLKNAGTDSEYNVWVKAKHDGSTTVVTHDGRRTISVIDKSGGTFNGARTTTVYQVEEYRLSDVVGTVGPVTYGGSSETLANEPYAHSGTPATDDTTADQLATDIAAALGNLGLEVVDDEILYRSLGGVQGVRDDVEEAYDVTFWIKKVTGDITVGGTVIKPYESKTEII